MKFCDNDKLKLDEIKKQYQYISNLLTYQEVLLDKKLSAKLLKDKKSISNLATSYMLYLDLQKYLNNLQSKNQFENKDEKALFQLEIDDTKKQIINIKNNILKMLTEVEAIMQHITIQIDSNNSQLSKQLLNDIITAYLNYCENNNFEHTLETIKNSTFINISGLNVKQIFENEKGVHIAINNNTQSTCNVFVYESYLDKPPTFNDNEIKIDVFRSNGAGGQHINKTDSAIRVTHLPTGIVATCQDQRSQLQNKSSALENLRQKVQEHYLKQKQQFTEHQKKQQVKLIKANHIVKTYDYENLIVSYKKQNIAFDKYISGEIF